MLCSIPEGVGGIVMITMEVGGNTFDLLIDDSVGFIPDQAVDYTGLILETRL